MFSMGFSNHLFRLVPRYKLLHETPLATNISTINHRIQPLMSQLKPILGAPSCSYRFEWIASGQNLQENPIFHRKTMENLWFPANFFPETNPVNLGSFIPVSPIHRVSRMVSAPHFWIQAQLPPRWGTACSARSSGDRHQPNVS